MRKQQGLARVVVHAFAERWSATSEIAAFAVLFMVISSLEDYVEFADHHFVSRPVRDPGMLGC